MAVVLTMILVFQGLPIPDGIDIKIPSWPLTAHAAAVDGIQLPPKLGGGTFSGTGVVGFDTNMQGTMFSLVKRDDGTAASKSVIFVNEIVKNRYTEYDVPTFNPYPKISYKWGGLVAQEQPPLRADQSVHVPRPADPAKYDHPDAGIWHAMLRHGYIRGDSFPFRRMQEYAEESRNSGVTHPFFEYLYEEMEVALKGTMNLNTGTHGFEVHVEPMQMYYADPALWPFTDDTILLTTSQLAAYQHRTGAPWTGHTGSSSAFFNGQAPGATALLARSLVLERNWYYPPDSAPEPERDSPYGNSNQPFPPKGEAQRTMRPVPFGYNAGNTYTSDSRGITVSGRIDAARGGSPEAYHNIVLMDLMGIGIIVLPIDYKQTLTLIKLCADTGQPIPGTTFSINSVPLPDPTDGEGKIVIPLDDLPPERPLTLEITELTVPNGWEVDVRAISVEGSTNPVLDLPGRTAIITIKNVETAPITVTFRNPRTPPEPPENKPLHWQNTPLAHGEIKNGTWTASRTGNASRAAPGGGTIGEYWEAMNGIPTTEELHYSAGATPIWVDMKGWLTTVVAPRNYTTTHVLSCVCLCHDHDPRTGACLGPPCPTVSDTYSHSVNWTFQFLWMDYVVAREANYARFEHDEIFAGAKHLGRLPAANIQGHSLGHHLDFGNIQTNGGPGNNPNLNSYGFTDVGDCDLNVSFTYDEGACPSKCADGKIAFNVYILREQGLHGVGSTKPQFDVNYFDTKLEGQVVSHKTVGHIGPTSCTCVDRPGNFGPENAKNWIPQEEHQNPAPRPAGERKDAVDLGKHMVEGSPVRVFVNSPDITVVAAGEVFRPMVGYTLVYI